VIGHTGDVIAHEPRDRHPQLIGTVTGALDLPELVSPRQHAWLLHIPSEEFSDDASLTELASHEIRLKLCDDSKALCVAFEELRAIVRHFILESAFTVVPERRMPKVVSEACRLNYGCELPVRVDNFFIIRPSHARGDGSTNLGALKRMR
jgi:hypothetical protein